jgi:hypothetical protein
MWNERMRLIRFRRKHERSSFREVLRLIPRWLVWTCVVLYVVALVVAIPVNLRLGGNMFPPELHDQPLLASLALSGLVTLTAIILSATFFMFGFVYRDAKRRGMHAGLWTLLVLILSPAYGIIGLIIYLLVREPLPFTCPQCAATVSARFNFCPNCKCNLRPACPHCQHEVVDMDKFCPYCAAELTPSKSQGAPAAADSPS